MSKIRVGNREVVVPNHETFLRDFDGNDALLRDSDEIKAATQARATASLPMLYARALQIAMLAKSESASLEAIKIIMSLSEGGIKPKQIDAKIKKFSDADLSSLLEGHNKDQGED